MDDNILQNRLQNDLIEIETVALAGGTNLARPLPTCPGWTVSDLLGHLWSIQSWVREVLRTRAVAPEREPAAAPAQAVADFIDGVPDYLTAMRAINADEGCWNFGPPPRLAGFWIRRQAHEHAVHLFDVQTALAVEPTQLTPAFAADGVDEILTMFYPRQVRLNRTDPVADAIEFRTADTGQTWTLGDGEPVSSVTAQAADLYLGLWKRLDLLGISQIEGDRAAVRRALGHALTP